VENKVCPNVHPNVHPYGNHVLAILLAGRQHSTKDSFVFPTCALRLARLRRDGPEHRLRVLTLRNWRSRAQSCRHHEAHRKAACGTFLFSSDSFVSPTLCVTTHSVRAREAGEAGCEAAAGEFELPSATTS
jgi:hypothetical protein